ncbi:hypothetical protein FB451DRAFT_1184861 [Mycena latifolia]|nr:hypothetical protein FB451DRAFT_1184861 [Mycena latifolia]
MPSTFTTILNMPNAVDTATALNMGASTEVRDANCDGPQCCHCGVRGGSHAPTCPFTCLTYEYGGWASCYYPFTYSGREAAPLTNRYHSERAVDAPTPSSAGLAGHVPADTGVPYILEVRKESGTIWTPLTAQSAKDCHRNKLIIAKKCRVKALSETDMWLGSEAELGNIDEATAKIARMKRGRKKNMKKTFRSDDVFVVDVDVMLRAPGLKGLLSVTDDEDLGTKESGILQPESVAESQAADWDWQLSIVILELSADPTRRDLDP